MSPNLTAALLAERARRVVSVEIPEIDATVSVRIAVAREGFEYETKNAKLLADKADIETRMAYMEDVVMALVVDPDTLEPVFSDNNRPSTVLPVDGFTALILGAMRTAGLMTKEVSTEAGPLAVEETTEALSGTPGTLPGLSTGQGQADMSPMPQIPAQTAQTATEAPSDRHPESISPSAIDSVTALPLN